MLWPGRTPSQNWKGPEGYCRELSMTSSVCSLRRYRQQLHLTGRANQAGRSEDCDLQDLGGSVTGRAPVAFLLSTSELEGKEPVAEPCGC